MKTSSTNEASQLEEFKPSTIKGFGILNKLIEHYFFVPQFFGHLENLKEKDEHDIISGALEVLNIRIVPTNLPAIPTKGRLIIVANHPFGILDGLIALSEIVPYRNDVRVVVNRVVASVSDCLSDRFIYVDPPSQKKRSSSGVKNILEWLDNEGAILIFPSGWVASTICHNKKLAIDDTWSPIISKIVRLKYAQVYPIFIHGRNSKLFYFIRKVNKNFASKLMFREFFNKRDTDVLITFGETIPSEQLDQLDSDRARSEYLKIKTHNLSNCMPYEAKQRL